MSKIYIKLFDNIFLKIFFFFLPFSYALTLNVGFPLKISEISILLLVGLIILQSKFKLFFLKTTPVAILSLFIVFAFISTFINSFWEYNYPLKQFDSRFGYKFDSYLKFLYLVISYVIFLISANTYRIARYNYNTLLIYGAFLASLYSWYLVIFSIFKLPVLLLPGMDISPQVVDLSLGTVIRCGTFKEGNQMGVFLLVAAIIAFFERKMFFSYFLLFSILSSFSSISIVCGFIFYSLYIFHKYFTRKHLHLLVIALVIFSTTLIALAQIADFKTLILDKFVGDNTKISNGSTYSKVDRLNSLYTALQIGMDNMILGVGLSNYSLHYDRYNKNEMFTRQGSKVIPNNVYAEVFCELGIIGLTIFILFLILLYKYSSFDKTNVLRFGLIAQAISFIASPSYTLIFIWVFWALILSQYQVHINEKSYH